MYPWLPIRSLLQAMYRHLLVKNVNSRGRGEDQFEFAINIFKRVDGK